MKQSVLHVAETGLLYLNIIRSPQSYSMPISTWFGLSLNLELKIILEDVKISASDTLKDTQSPNLC